MTSPKFIHVSIVSYIHSYPTKIQILLEQVRQAIKEAAPEAEETISYNMPSFKQYGYLVYFAANKNHIGFYPVPMDKFQKELAPYKSGKGTARFPLDKPMPVNLIKKIVKYRLKENLAKLKAKELKKK